MHFSPFEEGKVEDVRIGKKSITIESRHDVLKTAILVDIFIMNDEDLASFPTWLLGMAARLSL